MNPTQLAPSAARTTVVLALLFLGTFVQGTAELIVVGVLDLIAADLRVSVPAAGALVTANALGLALGGPILTVVTIKLNRRAVLIGALGLFVLAALVPVLTADYGLFVVARSVAGASQGLFIAAGFATAVSIVPPERMGRAISVVISGVAVSAALGVPVGTLIGQALGWRGTFAAVVAVAIVALAAIVTLVPSVPAGTSATGQVRYALAPRVLAVLGLGFLVFAALFAALTYLVPFLQSVTGVSGAVISLFLLIYGVATAVGSFGGGRFADLNAARMLIIGTVGITLALLALYLFGAAPALVAVALGALGLFGFGLAPSLQYRVVGLAGPGGQLAQSLPASAINLGIAFGSTAGGVAIAGGATSAAVVTGLVLAAVAILAALATGRLEPPTINTTTGATPPAAEPVSQSAP